MEEIRPCRVCDEISHRSINCPKLNCLACDEPGHIAAQCPKVQLITEQPLAKRFKLDLIENSENIEATCKCCPIFKLKGTDAPIILPGFGRQVNLILNIDHNAPQPQGSLVQVLKNPQVVPKRSSRMCIRSRPNLDGGFFDQFGTVDSNMLA